MSTKKIIMGLLCAVCCCQLNAKGFGRVYGGFSKLKQHGNAEIFEDRDYKGWHLGYMQSVNITHDKLPLFFQFGLKGAYVKNEHDGKFDNYLGTHVYRTDIYTINEKRFNLSIPLNIAYQIPVWKLSIEPFIGVNIRINIKGETTSEGTSSFYDWDWDHFDALYESPYYGEAHRVQIGMNTGLGINYKHIYLGYTFSPDGTDYLEIPDKYDIEDTKTTYHHFSIGWNF